MQRIYTYIGIATLVVFAGLGTHVSASEVEGTLSTGVQTGIQGYVVVAPTASPIGGSYTTAQSVTLTGGDGTVSIRYTTDGSAPTCATGTLYSGSISISTSTTLKAISCYPNNASSPIVTIDYSINTPASGGGGGGGGGGGTPIVTTQNNTSSSFDFDGNGIIDIFDFNILIVNWGKTSGATRAQGDTDGDGDVDIFDFNWVITNWLRQE